MPILKIRIGILSYVRFNRKIYFLGLYVKCFSNFIERIDGIIHHILIGLHQHMGM